MVIINMNESNAVVCGNRDDMLTLGFVQKELLGDLPEGDVTEEFIRKAFSICEEHGVAINFTNIEQINMVFSTVMAELKKGGHVE